MKGLLLSKESGPLRRFSPFRNIPRMKRWEKEEKGESFGYRLLGKESKIEEKQSEIFGKRKRLPTAQRFC